MKKLFKFVPVLIALVFVLSACLPVIGDPLSRYNSLIESYQNAREAASSSQACFALVGQQLSMQITVYNSYLAADVEKAKVYRDALAGVQSRIADASKAYYDSNGQPIPTDKLDLSKLVENGVTPADTMGGFNLMVNAFTEAPLSPVDPSALANVQRIISEQFNQAMSCVADWNSAAKAYNIERNQISGDVVGSIAEKLGVKDLPVSLPYYTPPAGSASPFDMTAPTAALP